MHKILLAPFLLVILAGCNSTKPIMLKQPSTEDEVVIGNISSDKTLGFEKAIVTIRRGDTIGAKVGGRSKSGSGHLCNYHVGGNITWGSGKAVLAGRDGEMSDIFRETLSSFDYSVVGDNSIIFERDKELSKATYQVAARITDIKANICNIHHWWDGRALGTSNGEISIDIEWSIYSSLQRETIKKIKTSGYAERKEEREDGFLALFLDAFADSAEHLAHNKNFTSIFTTEDIAVNAENPISIDKSTKYKSLRDNVNQILDSVVTVRSTSGHGSGFFISKDGYILTNYHVVGNAKKAIIKLNSGIELPADVIRKDKLRDVALIKVALAKSTPLPISFRTINQLDDVVAIGSPVKESLQGSITKGIVSAIRTDKQSNQRFIQSDVTIQPGSSGGPLLNEKGNVIGIAVAGYTLGTSLAGTNLFIPIQDGLDSLKVVID